MSYGDRLASAMDECDFSTEGGQSRLARAIGNNSQSISQALNSSSNLRAVFHVRACIRLGIRPLWLSEGRGLRYDPAGPRSAFPGGDVPYVIPAKWKEGFEAEQGGSMTSDVRQADLSLAEQALITKLRANPKLLPAFLAIVESTAVDGA